MDSEDRAPNAKKKGKPRGRPFPKGNIANPHGSPAWVREMRALAGSYAPEAMDTLFDLMRNAPKPEQRRAAADSILDRAGLKAFSLEPEKIELTANGSDDALSRFVALIGRRLAAVPGAGGHQGNGSGSSPDGSSTT